jgi:hypothetical protein
MKKYTTIIKTTKGSRNGKPFDNLEELKARKYRFNKMHGGDPNAQMNIYEFIDSKYELLGVHKTAQPFEVFIPEMGIMV